MPERNGIFFITRDTGTYTKTTNHLCGRPMQICLRLYTVRQPYRCQRIPNATTVAETRRPPFIMKESAIPESGKIFFIAQDTDTYTEARKPLMRKADANPPAPLRCQPISWPCCGFRMPPLWQKRECLSLLWKKASCRKAARYFLFSRAPAHTRRQKIAYVESCRKSSCTLCATAQSSSRAASSENAADEK